MEPEHRALLRAHRLELSGQLLVSDSIVPFLYQEDILTETQVELIESLQTDRLKTLKLLDLLPTRGPRAFPAFIRSLQDYSWVRDRLLLELQTRTGPGPGPGPGSGAGPAPETGPAPAPGLVSGPGPAPGLGLADVPASVPASVLLKVPSDRELSRLASLLGAEWESVLMDLGLSAEALFRCRSDHALSTRSAVLAGLVLWRRREGKNATVRRLQQSLQAAGVHPSLLHDVLM